MKIRLCYLVPFFLLLSCKHSSNPITDLSKENYDEIGELKLKGVVYDLYSPLFPQYHGYGIVRINIVQSNMEFYDPRNRLDEYLLLIKNKKAELQKRSVINWAEELDKNASLLILCGTEDKRVNPNQAQQIADRLAEINYDFRLKKFKTDHKFSGKTEELNALLINWFDTRLKKTSPVE